MSPGKFAFAGVIVLLAVGMWLLSGGDEEQAASSAAKPLDPKVYKDLRTDTEKRADAIRMQAGSQVSRILQGESVRDRAKAIAILRNLGPDALVVAREMLANADDQRGYAGAYVLAILGNQDDRDAVRDLFMDERANPDGLLALAAANLKDDFLASEFADLASSPDPQVREAAALGLRSGTNPDINTILSLLADAEPRVRAVAERSVTAMLPKADARAVREAVTRAIETGVTADRIGALALARKIDAPWVCEAAMKAAGDKKLAVRRHAIETLAATGDARAAKPLARLLETGRDRMEKVRAANAMGRIEPSAALLDSLNKAANGKDPIVALAAARSLVARQDVRGIPALIRLSHVKQSKSLNVDHEDSELLIDLPAEVLTHVSKGSRRSSETYEKWWSRVGRNYRVPPSPFLPEFPKNH